MYLYILFQGTDSTGCGENVEKSQTMDDVLEILIRTGGKLFLQVSLLPYP